MHYNIALFDMFWLFKASICPFSNSFSAFPRDIFNFSANVWNAVGGSQGIVEYKEISCGLLVWREMLLKMRGFIDISNPGVAELKRN